MVLVGVPLINQTTKGKLTSVANASPATIREEGKVERGQWAGRDTVASRVGWAGCFLIHGMIQKSLGKRCSGHMELVAFREM